MKDLQDTMVGFLGFAVFTLLYQQSPLYAVGMIGFHVGVTTMRAHRASRSTPANHHPTKNKGPDAP
jgi:hypothetical protein